MIMKLTKKLAVLIILMPTVLGAPQILAHDDDGGRSDGGAKLLRSRTTRFVQEIDSGSLKGQVTLFFAWLRGELAKDLNFIDDPIVREAIDTMLGNGVERDIDLSKYDAETRSPCGDASHPDAFTKFTPCEIALGEKITYCVAHLAQRGASDAERLGVAVHEHAHHFGFSDAIADLVEIFAGEVFADFTAAVKQKRDAEAKLAKRGDFRFVKLDWSSPAPVFLIVQLPDEKNARRRWNFDNERLGIVIYNEFYGFRKAEALPAPARDVILFKLADNARDLWGKSIVSLMHSEELELARVRYTIVHEDKGVENGQVWNAQSNQDGVLEQVLFKFGPQLR